MSSGQKVRLILLVGHITFAIWAVNYFEWRVIWLGLVSYVIIGKIGADIGMHRYFGHDCFIAKPWARKLFLFLSIPVGFGSPINWAIGHRIHHQKSDTKDDLHSPLQLGIFKVYFLLFYSNWESTTTKIDSRFIKAQMRDKEKLFIHKHYFSLYAAWLGLIILFSLLVDSQAIIYMWAIPIVVMYHVQATVNVVCHKWGYRTYETPDNSRNNIWLNLFVMGTAMHNNHHAKPWLLSVAGDKWYEFDLWGWIAKKWMAQ